MPYVSTRAIQCCALLCLFCCVSLPVFAQQPQTQVNQQLAEIEDYLLAEAFDSARTELTKHDFETPDVDVLQRIAKNELISNAYKSAFSDEDNGEILISVESLGEGQHELTVADNGNGLPDSFDFAKAKSLGLRLVRRLAQQLYGKVAYSGDGGAKFVVNFTDTLQRKAI